MRQTIVTALAGVALLVPSLSQAATWKSDPKHASVQFAVRHLMVATVRGTFDKFDVTATIDENDVSQSSVEATIEVASVNTRNEKRDNHLRGADFFDVAKHPTITFKSKAVEKIQDHTYKVTGDLTLMGVTQEVVLNVSGSPKAIQDPWGNSRLGGGRHHHDQSHRLRTHAQHSPGIRRGSRSARRSRSQLISNSYRPRKAPSLQGPNHSPLPTLH